MFLRVNVETGGLGCVVSREVKSMVKAWYWRSVLDLKPQSRCETRINLEENKCRGRS